LLENLEYRRFLHAGHDHSLADDGHDHEQVLGLDHISLTEFLRENPQLAGSDIWATTTFNPTNSPNSADWLYDPHVIEDDRPVSPAPEAPTTSAGPEALQLPDLVPLTGGGFLSPFVDKTEIPGHNLLRFSTAIGNQGTGPAILRSNRTGVPPVSSGLTSWSNPDGTQNVLQEIYDYNGSSFTFNNYRLAGRMVFHSAHNHFHLEGYANYRVLTNVGGQPGPVAIRSGFDNAPAVGDKVGFCLVNINNSFTMTNGQSSTTLQGYDPFGSQSSPSQNGQPQTTCGFLQGIHVGHADVYSSFYDGQWVDVTGVPNGNYFLEVTLDALDVIQESDETNNTVVVPFVLNTTAGTGGTIQPDQYEPNNSFAEATDLGVQGVETRSGNTIHITGEADYYRFVAASNAPGNVRLIIADRDVNLALFDSSFNLIGQSSSPATGTSGSPVTEQINFTPVAGETYYIRATGFGSDLNPQTSGVSSNYAVAINILPTVTGATAIANAAEQGNVFGRIDLARNGPVSGGLNVNITVGGTATRGVDYEIYHDEVLITGNVISIGAEASGAQLQIRPLTDALVETNETVTVAVAPGTGVYVVGGTTGGTVTIADVPPAVLGQAFNFETGHSVSFNFSLDVSASLAAGDLVVLDSQNQPVSVTSLNYVPAGNQAQFGFASLLPDGRYTATLSAAAVTHALGAPLSADAVVPFFVLAGDATRDESVNLDDFTALASNFGQTGRVFSQGDFDYNGNVNLDDFTILATQFGTTLPAGRFAAVRPVGEGASPVLSSSVTATGTARTSAFSSSVAISRIFDELEDRALASQPA